MGNIDGKSKFEGGYIYVKTDKDFYYAGEKVFGKMYIRAEREIDANYIEIRVKGKEKTSFWYNHHTSNDGESRTERRKQWYHNTHMDCKLTAFTFNTPSMAPGDYTIPFEFELP